MRKKKTGFLTRLSAHSSSNSGNAPTLRTCHVSLAAVHEQPPPCLRKSVAVARCWRWADKRAGQLGPGPIRECQHQEISQVLCQDGKKGEGRLHRSKRRRLLQGSKRSLHCPVAASVCVWVLSSVRNRIACPSAGVRLKRRFVRVCLGES